MTIRRRPKKPLRDAFGRFVKRNAPKLPPPERGSKGRFLSREDSKARAAESLQRLRDLAFLTPREFALVKQKELRGIEVKAEKIERRKRYLAKPEAYKSSKKPNKRTLEQANAIESGKFPKPNHIIRKGKQTEYVWVWQGEHSLMTAKEFLQLARTQMPADTMGYLAIGNGHGKNSKWVGTKFGSPLDIIRHATTLTDSKSDEVSELMSLISGEGDWGQEGKTADNIWTEVKLTTQGRLK